MSGCAREDAEHAREHERWTAGGEHDCGILGVNKLVKCGGWEHRWRHRIEERDCTWGEDGAWELHEQVLDIW